MLLYDPKMCNHFTQDAYTFALDGKSLPYTTWRIRPEGEEKYSNDCVFFNEKNFRLKFV